MKMSSREIIANVSFCSIFDTFHELEPILLRYTRSALRQLHKETHKIGSNLHEEYDREDQPNIFQNLSVPPR